MKFFKKGILDIFSNNQQIISKSVITINGVSRTGDNITIDEKGRIFFDGEDVTPEGKVINISVVGHIDTIKAAACSTITVTGDVDTLDAGMGNVTCNNVTGNVKNNMGKVECKDVAGYVETSGGNVKCLSVTGSVETGSGKVECEGNIGGNVKTGMGSVSANVITGNVNTEMGSIKYKK